MRGQNSIVSPAGLRLIDELVGRHPQTITELLQRLDVTRTAITEQLDDLVASGWVIRQRDHSGDRGRPKFRYSVSEYAASTLFPTGNASLIIPTTWQVLKEIGGDELLEQVLDKVCQRIVNMLKHQVPGPTAREYFLQSMQIMAPLGEVLKSSESPDGHMEISRRACGASALNDQECTLCRMHMKVLALSVHGGKVELAQHRHEGHPCCTFRLIETIE